MHSGTTNMEHEMYDYTGTGTTGTVTKVLKKNLEAMPGIHSIDSLQKTVILGISHIIRKVLQSEMGNLSGGDHRCFRSARKKRSVTRGGDDDDDAYYYYYYYYYNNNIKVLIKQAVRQGSCLKADRILI